MRPPGAPVVRFERTARRAVPTHRKSIVPNNSVIPAHLIRRRTENPLPSRY
jgi:hypothetical protein